MTTRITTRPRVFIASSAESLPEAKAINANLDHSTIPTLWPNGTFNLGSHALEGLTKKSSDVDFAVFIFTPDDIAEIRGRQQHIVRDNVLFELGLFIGALGKDRCFIVKPRGVDLHLPSDLLGIITADYAVDRGDDDLISALNFACTKIETEISRLGPLPSNVMRDEAHQQRQKPNPPNYKITPNDLRLLSITASSHVSNPEGLSHWQIAGEMKDISTNFMNMCAVKLMRLGYIERKVREDREGEPYYAISITEDGIDILLENEASVPAAIPAQKHKKGLHSFNDMDDDISF